MATIKPKGQSKRGPVEVIEGKGVKIPIYLGVRRGEKSFLLAYYQEGKRKMERVSSMEAARQRAKALIEDLSSGKVHIATFSLKQTAAITDAVEILQPLGISITEAARQLAEAHKVLGGTTIIEAAQFYAKHRAQEVRHGALQPITLPDLVTKYLASIEGKKSERYVGDLKSKLVRASKAFTGQIREIRANDIDTWIEGIEATGERTKNNYRMALLTLFSYARNKNYLPRGEQTEAEFVTRYDDKKSGLIGIYTPEQFAILLSCVDERFLPFVALGGFAGLRTIEILRLEWENIWFQKGYVEVGRDKSKTATRRLAPICPALEQWLKPHAKKTGPVIADINGEAHFRRLFHATSTLDDPQGQPRVKLFHNGLRHSFCSYRMAVTKSAAQVALEAGNSPKMLFEHYRELVTEAEGKEWFSLTPTVVRKIASA